MATKKKISKLKSSKTNISNKKKKTETKKTPLILEHKIIGHVPLKEISENTIFFMATEAGTLTNKKKEKVGSYGVTLGGSIYLILNGKNYQVSVLDAIDEINNKVISKEN